MKNEVDKVLFIACLKELESSGNGNTQNSGLIRQS